MFKVYTILTMSIDGVPNVGISSGINRDKCVAKYFKNQGFMHPEDRVHQYVVAESSLISFVLCLIIPGYKHDLGKWSDWEKLKLEERKDNE